jgi:hypothetical protein
MRQLHRVHVSEDRIAFNLKVGDGQVLLRLSSAEMDTMLSELAYRDDFKRPAAVRTIAWWDYMGLADGDDPRLEIYRDDLFSVSLPHQCGLDLVEALKERRPETAALVS